MRAAFVGSSLCCLLISSCGGEPEQQVLGCEPPGEFASGVTVNLDELGDPSEGPVEFEATDCVIVRNSAGAGTLAFDLDCGAPILFIEVEDARSPAAVGQVDVRVTWTEDRVDLRVTDELGPLLMVFDGALEPGVESPLSWQIGTDCARPSGDVGGHLVVRSTEADEFRLDVGESEIVEVGTGGDQNRWRVQTFDAAVDLGADAGRGSVAIVRHAG